jgi:hypothetical protein
MSFAVIVTLTDFIELLEHSHTEICFIHCIGRFFLEFHFFNWRNIMLFGIGYYDEFMRFIDENNPASYNNDASD